MNVKPSWPTIAMALLGVAFAAGQPKEAVPPSFVQVETARLAFHVSPAMARAVDAVNALRKLAGPDRIVKVRAFVAGPEDGSTARLIARRFAERHLRVPVIAVIRVAGFMDPQARVVLESVEETSDARNPAGLAFISGQATQAPLDARGSKIPLAEFALKSVTNLKSALSGLDLAPADVLRVTCFVSSLEDGVKVHGLVGAAFVHAAFNLMQVESAPNNSVVECEAVARLKVKPAQPVRLVNPTGAAFAQAAVVGAPRLVLTSTEPGAGPGQSFTRIKEVLAAAGSSLDRVFYVHAYPAGAVMLQTYRDVRWEFLDKAHAPASTNLPFDGVAAPGASIGIDVIALPAD
jgi:enamine deaminase RidA (YjgF/YER057c/UK114 family)